MKKIFLLFCLSLIFIGKSNAQSKGITPMHNFLQKYADSTIMLEFGTQSYQPNYYFILTKKGDTVNSFRYLPKMNLEQGLMPKAMKIIISMEKYKNFDAPAAINSFFNIVNLNQDTLKSIWARAINLNAWKIVEDNNAPICSDVKKVTAVIHCGDLMTHFITKDQIKTFVFNCPWVYEEYCPGNYNRKGAIAVNDLFLKYFPDSNH